MNTQLMFVMFRESVTHPTIHRELSGIMRRWCINATKVIIQVTSSLELAEETAWNQV